MLRKSVIILKNSKTQGSTPLCVYEITLSNQTLESENVLFYNPPLPKGLGGITQLFKSWSGLYKNLVRPSGPHETGLWLMPVIL